MLLIVFFAFIGGYFVGSCVAGALQALDRGYADATTATKPDTRTGVRRDAYIGPDYARRYCEETLLRVDNEQPCVY